MRLSTIFVTMLMCASVPAGASERDIAEKFLNRMPLFFERNIGQVAGRSAEWVGRANGYSIALDAKGATILPAAAGRTDVVRLEFVNGRQQGSGNPLEPLPGRTNYLVGRDPKRWLQNLETYGRVEYDGVYEGVDVAWYGNQGQLEYDFLVRPGADPNRIRVRFEGARTLALEPNGDVRIEAAGGAMRLRLPVVYQETAGERKRVEGRYLLRAANEIGFELAAYDKSKPLVIDPTLVYGSYFGQGLTMSAIVTDAQGNVYIGGSASKAGGLPLVNAMQTGLLASGNVFVAKFDPTGTALLYSTYVGGSGGAGLSALTVDASGELMAKGLASTDFPLANPVQTLGDGETSVPYVFKLNAAGSAFVYSTYFGTAGSAPGGIATDSAGNAYLCGNTYKEFPTTPGAYYRNYEGGDAGDAYVAKLGPTGNLIYATLLGGGGGAYAPAIVADSQGNAYVAGYTHANSFPNNPPGARLGNRGGEDVFVAKLTADGSALAWVAIMGGRGDDEPTALVRDSASGMLYIAGPTTSPDLPTTPGVLQPSANGTKQGFIASVAADGMSFGFVTYLGGKKEDSIAALARASSGQLVVAGSATSSDFPSVNAIQPTFGGSSVSLFKNGGWGTSWTPSDTGLPASIYGLSADPSNPGTILAALGSHVAVFRTTNGGVSWTAANGPLPALWYAGATGPRARFVRTPANPAAVYAYYPYTWASDTQGNADSFAALGSSDGGATWRLLAQPSPPNAGALAGMTVSSTNANTIVEIDTNGNVYRSTDGGASFIQVPNTPWLGMPWGYSPLIAGPTGTLYMSTYSGIYQSTDFGTTWTQQQPQTYNTWYIFASSPSNPSVIYASSYQMSKSTDGGATWKSATMPTFGTYTQITFLEVSPTNSQLLWASDGQHLSVSTDGAATWSTAVSVPSGWGTLMALAVDSSGSVYAADSVTGNTFAAKLSADGKTLLWSTFYGGASGSSPAGVATTASGDAWIAGATGSSDLPITPNAYSSTSYNGSAFLARISDATPACSYSLSPSSVLVYGSEAASFVVTAPSGCAWTATPSDGSWIGVQSGASGTGAGTVTLGLAANTTGATRTGTVNVQGQSFTIRQADSRCTYQVTGGADAVPSAGGTVLLTVTAGAGCPWSVALQSPVVSVISGGSGTGNGTVTLSLPANSSVETITTAVQVGSFINLTEQSSCRYSVSPSMINNVASSGTMTVTANLAGCYWYAQSSGWLQANGSATGSGTIKYTAQANTGPPRTATIQIGDQQVTITQTVLPLQFVPVAPCRVVDTRNANGPFGGPRMRAEYTRSFAIPDSACGIPSAAQAYSLNVTVVPPGRLSYLTLWPDGQTRPNASTLNSWDGEVLANAAIVPAGSGGAVDVYVTDPTDVILDINGYFDTPSASTAAFYAASPCRVADTRSPDGPFGGPSLAAGGSRDFAVSSSGCGIPSGASGYSLNVTAVPDDFLAFLTVWPAGQQRPMASTLNSWTGKVVANAAIVPSGNNDSVSVYGYNPTDVIMDINGYFARGGLPGALSFYPVTPCRVADTRGAAGPILESGTMRSFGVPASGCNIPNTAQAYAMNVTVVPEGPLWYLTAWPAGAGQPNVSTLNSWDGSVVANAAIVPAGADGAISVYASGRTHVILDINGYFAP